MDKIAESRSAYHTFAEVAEEDLSAGDLLSGQRSGRLYLARMPEFAGTPEINPI